jgi:hypothetical protein
MRRIAKHSARSIRALLGVAAVLFLVSGCDEPEPQGHALAIGLNRVDPAHYGGWDGQLWGCEPDAKDMRKIAADQGFQSTTLLTEQATRRQVLDKLADLAGKLKSGDLLVVSYSGHGGQVPDTNGDESDGLDETWCLYDGQLIDDELYGAWKQFKEGVRILVFCDSCHSGTAIKVTRADLESPSPERREQLQKESLAHRVPKHVDRGAVFESRAFRNAVEERPDLRTRVERLPRSSAAPDEPAVPLPVEDEDIVVCRAMPYNAMWETYQQNQADYDKWGKAAPKETNEDVVAAVILIAGCEDPQFSADLGHHGLFTWELLQVWDNGNFTGDYEKFRDEIKSRVVQENPDQEPFLFTVGHATAAFVQQQPYSVQ